MTEETSSYSTEASRSRYLGDGLGRVLLREPTLIITFAYALTALIGVWGSYWYFHALGVPILEFLQIGDFFTAGLRDPVYIGIALASMLLTWLAYIPYGWRFTQPERYTRLRRRWWFRMTYPHMPTWSGLDRLRPGIGLAVGMLFTTLGLVMVYVEIKADRLRKDANRGTAIDVDGRDAGAESLRLLGTTTAYVFVWNGVQRRVEVLPIESITHIAMPALPQPRATKAEAPTTAPDAVVAPPAGVPEAASAPIPPASSDASKQP